MRRIQIYLDDDQARRLDELAAARGATRSTVIRRAVDQYLEQREKAEWQAQWREAVEATAGIAPYLGCAGTN